MSEIVIVDILGQPHHPAEYHAVPRVTFTDPEIGSVGLSEARARDQGLAVRTAVSEMPASTRGWPCRPLPGPPGSILTTP